MALGKKILIICITFVLILAAASVSVVLMLKNLNTNDEAEEIIITKTQGYSIVYGHNTPTGGKMAYSFKSKFSEVCADFNMVSDTEPEGEFEILMGETNRELSVELMNKAHKEANENSHVWGFAFKDGKLAVYANNSGIALDKALEDFKNKYFKNGEIAVTSQLFEVFEYTRKQQEADALAEEERIKAEQAAKRQEKAEEYKLLLPGFTNQQFGEITQTLGDDYASPTAYPVKGEHPRLLINKTLLANLEQTLNSAECRMAVDELFELANTETDGKLPPATIHETGRKGEHNYDSRLLAAIQAKALAYLITGEEYYGYGAILAMKNYILTLDIKWIHSDQCREFGYVMYITALVYDWCYPLLSENDKHQLIAGVENHICRGTTENTQDSTYGGVKMEIGFPPSREQAISGHGTEMQLLRDYLSFAVAIFDEAPDWWEYIGGRFYEEFVPVRNVFYGSGMYPQGTACYAPWRHMGDLWAAWIVTSFGAESPYNGDVAAVTRSFFSHETYGDELFNTGDGYAARFGSTYSHCALIASAVYEDSALRAWAKHLKSGFNIFSYGVANVTPAEMIILSTMGTETAESRYEGFKTVHYNAYPLGQMIVRPSFNSEEACVVLMKIGERTSANHSHQDCGSFQIYYKGLISAAGGVYDKYGSDHHRYFHQATVSHNGLLIYNPSLATTNKGWYSGGQKLLGEASGIDKWESGLYETGKVIGASSGYFSDGVTPSYAYLAGDITNSYSSATVDYVGRRMLTVYTGEADLPMVMFIYDSITSDNADFKKTFLLQAQTEPSIENGRVVIDNGEGKLTLSPVIGADTINAFGFDNDKYYINGESCESLTEAPNDYWGRVELSHSGTKTSEFLNILYVSDSDCSKTVTPQIVETTSQISGVVGNGICAVFVKDSERYDEMISFTARGEGKLRYFISGVCEGEWLVSVNSGEAFTVISDEAGGLLSFTADAGEITLTPKWAEIPDGYSEIKYVLNGGNLSNAPELYRQGETTVLPTPTSSVGNLFLGWFLDNGFTQPITEISSSSVGKITVYAKWKDIFITDFAKSNINKSEVNVSYGTAVIQQNDKKGASVKTEITDSEGYLVWTKGDNDPSISNFENLAELLGEENKITFRLTLAKHADKSTFASNFRLRGVGNDGLLSYSNVISLFKTDDNGNVTLSDSGVTILALTDKLSEFSITVDFQASTITAYDKDGVALHSVKFKPNSKSGADNALEWKKQLTSYTFNWYGGGTLNSESDSALRIGQIIYYVGDFIK